MLGINHVPGSVSPVAKTGFVAGSAELIARRSFRETMDTGSRIFQKKTAPEGGSGAVKFVTGRHHEKLMQNTMGQREENHRAQNRSQRLKNG
jgi:hypothetical protein